MSLEEWRPISGYEDYYMVSNFGRVKSIERTITRKDGVIQTRREKIKALRETYDGYLTVKLSKGGINKQVAVHILVAKAFVSGWFDGAEVNHKDFDRKNNVPENLEWVSHRDNVNHTLLHGRHVSQWGNYNGSNNPNFGNHKLKEKYSNDKELSKIKQSRPGAQNGRATPIRMYTGYNTYRDFDYIKACAQYLIDEGITSSKKVPTVTGYISKALSDGSHCFGYRFSRL